MARSPTDADRTEALSILFSGIAHDRDVAEIVGQLWPLHPRHNTFPGEVFMEVAADALALAAPTRDRPIRYEGLGARCLPEIDLRGKSRWRFRAAFYLATATRAGIEVDMFDDVARWNSDDYWLWSTYATMAIIRAAAAHLDTTAPELARKLARQYAIDLSPPHESPETG